MKIRTIELHNYRAFYRTHTISVEGKSMLIYGENGSGKSSLYKAMEDFFTAANQSKSVAANIFDDSSPYVKVIMDTDQTFVYQNDSTSPAPTPNFLIDTHCHNPFFTYKRLLRSYLAENEAKRPDVFSILVETILPYHTNDKSERKFGEDWTDINDALQMSANTKKYKQVIKTTLPNFNDGLEAFLEALAEKTNDWLNRYFNHHVTLTFEKPTLSIQGTGSKKIFAGKEITITPTYFGASITSRYEEFLNEARLSALALCMYLSSLKIIPEPANYKMLFLDDIFIGLDMSNRIPLLQILKENFADFQIFLTTYDRHWFEIAKLHLKTGWQAIEMYVGQKDGLDFEFPIIIAPSDDYYTKAEKYFHKKSGGYATNIDYPAAANYLRKEYERLLKEKLFGNYRFRKGENGETLVRKELGELKDMFKKMIDDLELDWTPFKDIDIIIKTTLNPFSHDNLEKPIYKNELKEAFRLADVLRALKKSVLLSENELLFIEKTHTTGAMRKTVLKVNGNVLVLKQGNNWKIPKCELRPLYYIENDHREDLSRIPECDLNKAYDMISHHMYGEEHASKKADIYAEFRSETTGKTLKEMVDAV